MNKKNRGQRRIFYMIVILSKAKDLKNTSLTPIFLTLALNVIPAKAGIHIYLDSLLQGKSALRV